ncbi:MAG: SpoIIE family protein phosphatase, partial [Leptospiraceae bacterium]|nr:SpoIIE family protein phosphatase [Leptospiraceae bacterium]
VKLRTAELEQSLQTVRELKIKQDGDYFLTSLLLKPLNGCFSQSENTDVEIFLKQKKEFSFRKWETEIGGDLCLSYNLTLKSRDYVVFINADAMGKSIQGAGGALVAGVVFKSVVTRTQLSSAGQNKEPERWLKDCFSELQNTFISFDGSMLLSAVIGLVADKSGFCYYINAEHPYPALLRDGKAVFLGTDAVRRKIGIDAIETPLVIETIQLQRGDVLQLGSDGRDDLLLSFQGEQRVINEDESLFLRNLENSRGIQQELVRAIEQCGQLTDDLSLLRISWQEDAPLRMNAPPLELYQKVQAGLHDPGPISTQMIQEIKTILHEHPHFNDAWLLAARISQTRQDWHIARQYYQEYTARQPADLEAVFQLVLCCKKLKDYRAAVDYAEAIRLRDRENLRNLIALADCYRLLSNSERARKILLEAKGIDPAHPNVIKLDELLQ